MDNTITITTEKLNSANVAVKSSGMTDYVITSNVGYSDNKVRNVENGQVQRISDNAFVADFSTYNMGMPDFSSANLTVTYKVTDVAVQCVINQKINEFLQALMKTPINPLSV